MTMAPGSWRHRIAVFSKRWRFVFWGLVAVGVIVLAAISLITYVDGQGDRKDAADDRAVASDQRADATQKLAVAAKLQADIAAKLAEETKARSVSKQQLAALRNGLCNLVWIYENPGDVVQPTEDLKVRAAQVRLGWRTIGENPVLNCPDGIKPTYVP